MSVQPRPQQIAERSLTGRFAGEVFGVEAVLQRTCALGLATLLPEVERAFDGLDRIAVWHRRCAVAGVSLLAGHLPLVRPPDPRATSLGSGSRWEWRQNFSQRRPERRQMRTGMRSRTKLLTDEPHRVAGQHAVLRQLVIRRRLDGLLNRMVYAAPAALGVGAINAPTIHRNGRKIPKTKSQV